MFERWRALLKKKKKNKTKTKKNRKTLERILKKL